VLNPGNRSWGAIAIPAAGTYVHPTIFENLAGALTAMFYADFTAGSGGTSVKLYWQTSLDGGTIWFDVACIAFATSAGRKIANLTALAAVNSATLTDTGLADNTVLAGALIDRLRLKYVVVGPYTGASVSPRANLA